MKKANPDALPLFDEETEDEEASELARVVPIRTETALTRKPFHRISKRGNIKIENLIKNERGQVISNWEVRNPPGPLAYKIDTLVINRYIDDLRPNIPKLIKLGSLREVCEELGFVYSGRTAKQITESLYQNAAAFIRTKIIYKGNDGTERTFEFGDTRYGVILTGEKLPNGKKADAVYIALHDTFLSLLTHSKTRPLDYKYLRELAPAPQRLYELLSFAIFGTLMHGRPNAQMLYSEFCQSAPLTRHSEFYRVRSQMRKIHKPHLESGYIKMVEFQETTDEQGIIDWLMKYTPGRKARHEFREFTKKKEKQLEQKEAARPRLVTPKLQPKQTQEDATIIEKLMSLGIGEDKAAQLVTTNRAECELWAGAWQYQNQKGMGNPAAVLISFIEKKRRPLPKGYREAKEHEARQRGQEQEAQRQFAETTYFDYFAPQYRAYQRDELQAIKEKHSAAFATFEKWLEKNHGRGLRMVNEEATREKLTLRKADEFFTVISPELGITMTSFQEWDEQHNSSKAEPLEWYAQNPHLIENLYK